MTIPTFLGTLFLCSAAILTAQESGAPVVACNLKAISAADRPHYEQLMRRIHASIRERNELRDGYSYKVDGKSVSLKDAAEWIGLERLCCPFFTFELSVTASQTDWTLKLTGPAGVKELLAAELPAR
jgi:hypothetical protein